MKGKRQLVKDWIQYLKNNRIVAGRSDPSTGKLKYFRKVTTQDLIKFLEVNEGLDAAVIRKAIRQVVNKDKETPDQQPAGAIGHEPGQKPDQLGHDGQQKKKLPFNGDIEGTYREKPDQPGLPSPGLKEAFRDNPGITLSEEQVEEVFDILLSQSNKPEEPAKNEPKPEEVQSARDEGFRKIKRVIRDTMTPQQRKALWRALNEV